LCPTVSGTGHPGYPGLKGHKTVVAVVITIIVNPLENMIQREFKNCRRKNTK